MGFQDILTLIQTTASIISLIISLITLNKVNKIEKSDSHNRNINKQIAIGSGNKQKNQK